MRRVVFSFILLVAGLGWLTSETVQADELPRREQPTWYFEFANDALSGADSQFTNGITIQKHSTASYNLSDF